MKEKLYVKIEVVSLCAFIFVMVVLSERACISRFLSCFMSSLKPILPLLFYNRHHHRTPLPLMFLFIFCHAFGMLLLQSK